MKRLSTNIQISVSLASITVTVLMLARLLGLCPDQDVLRLETRAQLVRMLAAHVGLAAQRGDRPLIEQSLQASLQWLPGLQGCRWKTPQAELEFGQMAQSSTDRLELPISLSGKVQGTLTLSFEAASPIGAWWSRFYSPFVKLLVFVGGAQLLLSWLYLKRVLNYLDPSRVLPDRVRSTLDSLAEGLIVVDQEERIILANRAFTNTLGRSFEELMGLRPSQFDWRGHRQEDRPLWPWRESLEQGRASIGSILRLPDASGGLRTFRVNSVPLLDDNGHCSGAMTSFDDVTALEERAVALTRMLAKLKASRDQIRRQNQQLHLLATRDPLTSALNRRSFFEQFEQVWRRSQETGQVVSCLLLDVDHFKRINDTHGHAKGDEVLKMVVSVLHRCVRSSDLVCRHGGEEFCILLPNTPPDAAAASAERFRHEIAATRFEGLRITASFGISSSVFGARSTQELLEQADQALYGAKRSGRNRVVRWDQMPDPSNQTKTTVADEQNHPPVQEDSPISFQIVTALTSALAYRDAATAEHSRRVADLCLLVARDLLPLSKCYILENAALLHDIGKIGVPDAILLKPGSLTKDEWSVMRSHDEIGVEIIRSTFACDELTEIVMFHHAHFGGRTEAPDLPVGEAIPLGARILTIADAYDAMVTDRVYRQGLSQDDAFAELRKCAPKQFDPQLVERFIQAVRDRRDGSAVDTSQLTKTAALRLGVQIESLARAVDARDLAGLRNLSDGVYQTAVECGISEVARLAQVLRETIEKMPDNADDMQIVSLTVDLMELCRQTQRAHLATHGQPAFPRYVANQLGPA